MKKLSKILIATGIVVLITLTIGLAMYISSSAEYSVISVPMEQTVIVTDSVATPAEMKTDFMIKEKGDYSFYTEFSAEQPGMITGMIVYDNEGNNVFAFTAESCKIESKIMTLEQGIYSIEARFLTSEEALSKFLEDARIEPISEDESGNIESESEEPYEFAENFNLNMKYRFEITSRQSYTAGKQFGLLCGILLGFLLVYISCVIIKKDDSIMSKYDERQELVRGRGYKYAFFFMFLYSMLLIIMSLLEVPMFADLDVLLCFGIFISVCIYACYCIWNDGYYAINENRRMVIIIFAVAGLMNTIIAVVNMFLGNMINDGRLNFRCINFLGGGVMIIVLIVTLLKDRKERKEVTDEEP